MDNKIFQFGEHSEGYNIPVLNEREIRAAAGILFVVMFISVMFAILKGDFFLLKYAITFFFIDICTRVLINPRFAPSLIIGRLIVRNQNPEYVGAMQKKFAWIVGIILSGTAFVLIVVMNTYSPITGLICMVCLLFLFFETAFGICLGCIFYKLIYREKTQYCPGEVCDIKSRSNIQKLSAVQYLAMICFIIFVFFVALFLNENFKAKPHSLFAFRDIPINYSQLIN
jgi:hypothetical protein